MLTLLFITVAVGIDTMFEIVISAIISALIGTSSLKAEPIKTPENLKD